MFCLFLCLLLCLTDNIFYQSAALPPLAAPAQTWKPTSANMNTFMATTAAAASAQIQVGSALSVFSIQPPELESGSQSIRHFAQLKAVAARVSDRELFFFTIFPQVFSAHQTTLTSILTTLTRLRQYKWRVGRY